MPRAVAQSTSESIVFCRAALWRINTGPKYRKWHQWGTRLWLLQQKERNSNMCLVKLRKQAAFPDLLVLLVFLGYS